jgi:hypothetical protein
MVFLSCIPVHLWPYCFHAHFIFCPKAGLPIFFTHVSWNRQLNRLRWLQWWVWRNLPLHLRLPTRWTLWGDLQNATPANCRGNTIWYCITLCPYYTSPFLHHSPFSSFCLREQSAEYRSRSSSNFHRLNCRTWSQRHHFALRHAWLLKSMPLGHLDNMML